MQPRTAIFGTLGVLATALGAVLLFVPGVLFGVGPVEEFVALVATIEATTLALVAGALTMVSLFVTARSRPAPETAPSVTSADPRFERAAVVPPEQPTASPGTLTGSAVDDTAREAVEEGGEALEEVRRLSRETATSAYAAHEGVTVADAARRIERGEWTDDPVVAAFLAGPEGPPPSLAMRLRLWLTPARERARRLDRTVAAIERVSDR